MPNDTVTVFSPEGEVGQIPAINWEKAKTAGYEMAQPVVSPAGDEGHVPSSKWAEAQQAGYKAREERPKTVTVTDNSPGYGSEIWSGIKRGSAGILGGIKNMMTPHDTYGATKEEEGPMGPVGRLLYNTPADLLQSGVNMTKGRKDAAARGENWAGQVLGSAENAPLVGDIVKKAEKAGPGYAKFTPDTAGAVAEGATMAAAPIAAEKALTTLKEPFMGKVGDLETGLRENFNKAVPPTNTHPYDIEDLRRATPHLMDMHAASPFEGVSDFEQGANSAIQRIEGQVKGYIGEVGPTVVNKNVLADVERGLSGNADTSFSGKGLSELRKYGLDKPLTLEQAENLRAQLNAENSGVLQRNNYDRATARQVDPGFAARELAANAIRDGEYTTLKDQGFSGVDDLRRDEGSIIKLRDAANAKRFAGEQKVTGTAKNSALRTTAKALTKAAGTGIGGYVAGVPGAIAGSTLGDAAANLFTPGAMTRDELIVDAFPKKMPGERPSAVFPKREFTPTRELPASPLGRGDAVITGDGTVVPMDTGAEIFHSAMTGETPYGPIRGQRRLGPSRMMGSNMEPIGETTENGVPGGIEYYAGPGLRTNRMLTAGPRNPETGAPLNISRGTTVYSGERGRFANTPPIATSTGGGIPQPFRWTDESGTPNPMPNMPPVLSRILKEHPQPLWAGRTREGIPSVLNVARRGENVTFSPEDIQELQAEHAAESGPLVRDARRVSPRAGEVARVENNPPRFLGRENWPYRNRVQDGSYSSIPILTPGTPSTFMGRLRRILKP